MQRVERKNDFLSTLQRNWFPVSLVVVAIALRLWHLGQKSLRTDEAFSVWTSFHSISDLLRILETDTHPPFFYLFLHGWLTQGFRESFLRLPFALFGVGNALLVYWIGLSCFDRRTARLAGGFWAVSFLALFAETQVRMYPMATFLSLLSTSIFIEAFKTPAFWKWILYVVSATLSLYTHYYTGFVILAHLLFLFWSGREKQATWVALAVAALFVPWSAQFAKQFFMVSSASPIPLLDPEFLSTSVFLGINYLFADNLLASTLVSAIGLFILVTGICLFRAQKNFKVLALLLFFVPALMILGVAWLSRQHAFSYRYLLLFAPYFFLFFFYGLSKFPRSVWIPLFACLFVLNLALWWQFLTGQGQERQNWRGACDLLNAHVREGDTVVVEWFMSFFPLWYYLPNQFEIQYVPGKYAFVIVPRNKANVFWIPAGEQTPALRLEKICEHSKRQWLVLCQDWVHDPSENVAQWFLRHRPQSSFWDFRSLEHQNNIRIFLFEKQLPAAMAPEIGERCLFQR